MQMNWITEYQNNEKEKEEVIHFVNEVEELNEDISIGVIWDVTYEDEQSEDTKKLLERRRKKMRQCESMIKCQN